MRRYVCDTFQHSSYGYYNNSPGSVLFLEKQISMKQINLFLGLWCSTTYSIYESALNIICQEANIILFMFSLVNKSSINSIKAWYEQAQSVNKKFIPILIGTKYDIAQQNISPSNPLCRHYLNEYHKITRVARKFAMKMNASLIYISSKDNININHVIKTCVAKVFNIKPKLKEYHWNTLKALREHNITKLLKLWSSHKKMKYLVRGYLKRESFQSLFIIDDASSKQSITKNIIENIINFCQYTLKPLTSSHSKKKSHRKKNSSRISTKSSRNSEKRSSDKRHSRRTSSRISTKSDKKNSEKRSSEKKKSSKSRRKSSKIRKKKDKDKNKDKDTMRETDRSEKKHHRRKSSRSRKRRKPSKISKSNEMYTIHENLVNNVSELTGSPSIQLPVIEDYNSISSIPKLGLSGMAASSNASSLMDHYEGYDVVIEGSEDPMV